MKITIVQIRPAKGDIPQNIAAHVKAIEKAAAYKADLIAFPELSLTGYEPTLAKALATTAGDLRLVPFQRLSDQHGITIGVGLPTADGDRKLYVSMIYFRPLQKPVVYNKQFLHPTEVPYFTPGERFEYLKVENEMIAPAICYELCVAEHSETAHKNGATCYIASVLNSVSAFGNEENDWKRLSAIAKKI